MIGERALIASVSALGVGLASAGPSLAQEDLVRWASGCETIAVIHRGRVAPVSDAYRQAGETANFWRGALERAEPDPAKRDAERADARKALDADLANKSSADGAKIIAAAFAACAPLRKFVESQQETGEVKP